jgi:putative transposase
MRLLRCGHRDVSDAVRVCCMEHGTRRLAHVNVTEHPSADWTLHSCGRSSGTNAGISILSMTETRPSPSTLMTRSGALGAEVLRSPIASPKANSLCERVIGTIRRECLDWMIPLSEGHLRSILKSWVEHYNRGRPRTSLGPGVPDPPPSWPRSGNWSPSSTGGGCRCTRKVGAGWTPS